MIKRNYTIIATLYLCVSNINCSALPLQTSLSMGANIVDSMTGADKTYGALRISFIKQLYSQKRNNINFNIGLETGNRMRLNVPNHIQTALGGLPFETELKPILDGLLGFNIPLNKYSMVANINIGAAMRKWQFDNRCSSYDRVRINPEFQLGFSQKISKNYQFFIFYRYIMGSEVRYKFDSEQENLQISGIPHQQGVFIGTKIF